MLLITDPEVKALIAEALYWKRAYKESGRSDDFSLGGYAALKRAVMLLTDIDIEMIDGFFDEIDEDFALETQSMLENLLSEQKTTSSGEK